MPALAEIEDLAMSPAGRWAEREAVVAANTVARKSGLNFLDLVENTASKLDSGTLELSRTRFPALNQSADFTFRVNSATELRSVKVHLPPNFSPSKPVPAYFLMDGAQYGDPEGEMLHGYHWAETADRNGFAAISLVQSEESTIPMHPKFARMFPEHSTWRSEFNLTGAKPQVDDLSFFRNVLNGVRRAMNIGSVNLVGFCDGGCLAHGLATKMPFNGVATVGSTMLEDTKVLPLPGTRGFFATMEDDLILPESGGPGRSFGKALVHSGHKKVLGSAPLDQGSVYARASSLVRGAIVESAEATERTWINPITTEVGVRELSFKEGGHNWPGTRFSKLSTKKSEQISPKTALALNQRIVSFFEL